MKTVYQVAKKIAGLSNCNVFKVSKNEYSLNDKETGGYRGEISASNLSACGFTAMHMGNHYELI